MPVGRSLNRGDPEKIPVHCSSSLHFSVSCNESGGNPTFKGSSNTDSSSSRNLVVGSNPKDIKKSNEYSQAPLAKGCSMMESSPGGGLHTAFSARGDPSQVNRGSRDGTVIGGAMPGIHAAAMAGENRIPMGPRPELLLPKTPTQSWPNSPANLKAALRSRNFSEGSFNLIFPGGDFENGAVGSRSNTGSPSRSSFWSTDSGDSKSTSSSSDGCLHGSTYSPVSSLGAVICTRPSPENPSELGFSGMNPARDVQFARNSRVSHQHMLSSASQSISSTTLKPSKDLTKGPVMISSRPEGRIPQCGSSKTGKLSNLEHQSKSASDVAIAQTSYNPRGTPALGHSEFKTINQGIITGGSFGSSLSTSYQNAGTSEGMAPPLSGNSAKGHGQNATKPTVIKSSFGNIIKESSRLDLKKPIVQTNGHVADDGVSWRVALSSMDPEEVKNYGNELYKKGHFSEALSLYERAIAILPGQALYHSNRAAALAAVGRLGDAVQDCQEAVKLDPSYGRAHHRLASLFLRLGQVEDAKQHLKFAGSLCGQRDIQQSDSILRHIMKCLEARRLREWANVIRESDAAVVAGADSALKVFAFKAEALLHLGKTDEAKRVISAAQKVENSLRGSMIFVDSIVQVIQAEIDLALGNFQEAIVAAEKAIRIDSKNTEATAILQKIRVIGKSRTMGNDLYKAGKYFESSAAYGEGLEYDPTNAILLCNRAACRSNLGLWESAIEDCDAALATHPSYTKARLRRAYCLTKLERWEEALWDYEMLKRELPGDIEVARALFDAQTALKKSLGQEPPAKVFGEGVDIILSTNQFKEAVTCPGVAVVHFNAGSNLTCRQVSAQFIRLRQKYPAVNFLQVDVEENIQLAKLENITTVPIFHLYRNSLKVTEIQGPSYEALEQAMQLFSL